MLACPFCAELCCLGGYVSQRIRPRLNSLLCTKICGAITSRFYKTEGLPFPARTAPLELLALCKEKPTGQTLLGVLNRGGLENRVTVFGRVLQMLFFPPFAVQGIQSGGSLCLFLAAPFSAAQLHAVPLHDGDELFGMFRAAF